MKLMSPLSRGAALAALACGLYLPAAADVEVNSVDNNAPNLGNLTTESETFVARSGSLVVVGYNTSRQAGLLGIGAWTSLSGYAYSTNGGASFTDGGFVPAGSYTLEGDPALGFDRSGNLYYASLLEDKSTGASYIGVNKSTSTSPAVTFGNPVVIAGKFSTSGGFQDKEFLAVDNTGGPYDGRVYVAWSEFPSSGNPQAMLAASSSTSPLTFGPALLLAPSSSSFQHGTNPQVGVDGSVYVVWSTLTSFTGAASATINMVKSTNGGASFANPDPADPSPTKTIATFTSTTGNIGTGSVSLRTRSFPYLAVDRTPVGSPTRGNLYVVFQGQPNSATPPRSEIFFSSSTDGGKTWSAARNISSGPAATLNGDPTSNDNWMPSIAVSPTTGHIKVLFYSRREDPANQKIRVYEAGSTDGGMTWYNSPYSAVAFTPSVGYDPLINSTYMGDYLFAAADPSNLLGAWGDTRNQCAPPSGAAAPCSPTGRGDQDVWSGVEADVTGIDLAITPWGYTTGVGPTWQTPDIFVVNSANVQVNAEKGVHNALRARIRNLGNANATGAVVRFRYAPIYGSVPDSAFKLIGTATVNVNAGATTVVPIDWDLTNLSDTNGGIWPQPISAFDHFCARVDIELVSDINLSNNAAQNNFSNVSTGMGPLVINFLVGNPFVHPVKAQIVVPPLPKEFRQKIKDPVLKLPLAAPAGSAATAPAAINEIALREEELKVGTITLTRPPKSLTQHLTHDIVVDVNTVVDGKTIGGFSFLLARANVPAPRPPAPGSVRIVSERIAQAAPSVAPAPRRFEITALMASDAVHRAVLDYLASQNIRIVQNDPARGLVSANAIELSHSALLEAITPQARALVPGDAGGRYYLSIKTTPGERQGTQETSHVEISVRIIAVAGDLDSPLGGRLLPSNGTIEETHLRALTPRFNAR